MVLPHPRNSKRVITVAFSFIRSIYAVCSLIMKGECDIILTADVLNFFSKIICVGTIYSFF